MTQNERSVILYGNSQLSEMLSKGNVWYVRHHEVFFQSVSVLYFMGKKQDPVTANRTTLVSLGTGNRVINFILAPWRLYQYAKKKKDALFITGDLMFAWWTSILIKLLLRARIVLIPVCIPEEIYKHTRKSLSCFPISFERIATQISFRFADVILTSKNIPKVISWLQSTSNAVGKLMIVDVLVDELPPYDFFSHLTNNTNPIAREKNRLLYVGRLHKEKRVHDLIRMMSILKIKNPSTHLSLIGDGPEKDDLVALANQLNVSDHVTFHGFMDNTALVDYYKTAGIFISTVTGTSLREAALCGMPVVAYDLDWVRGVFRDGDNALLAAPGNYEDLAAQVGRALDDDELRTHISTNIRKTAVERWGTEKLEQSLRAIWEATRPAHDSLHTDTV